MTGRSSPNQPEPSNADLLFDAGCGCLFTLAALIIIIGAMELAELILK